MKLTKKQTSLPLLKLYRVKSRISTYLVNAYSAEDAIRYVDTHDLEETYGFAEYDYVAKQIDTTREGIVLDEVD